MKRAILIAVVFLCFIDVKASTKPDSIFYLNYNVGFNNVLGNGNLSLPYGVDFAEKARGPGLGLGIGLEVLFQKKWGVGISGTIGVFSTNRSRFETQLKDLLPSKDFIYDDDGYFSRGLSGSATVGWEAYAFYDFIFEKCIVRPILNFGYVSGGAVAYSYTTRVPSTNLITNYSIRGSSESAVQLGAGVEISPTSYRPIALFLKINSSRFINNYTASVNDVYGNVTKETFTSNYAVLFLDIGFSLGFDLFMKQNGTLK